MPQTFDEFNRIAAFFTRANNPDSPVEYGATLTLGSTGVAGSEFLSRIFSVQEDLFDDHGLIHLDSPVAIRALEQMISLLPCTEPDRCKWWTDTAEAFAGGNVAMTILYNNFTAPLLSSHSRVPDKIGYAMVPGNRPILGGGSLGVSKYSKQPEQAMNLVRWFCSEPVSSAAAMLGGTSSCSKSYNNYEIINNYPWLRLAKKCFHSATGRRLPETVAAPFNERRFLGIIGRAVKSACSGALSPEEALLHAQKQYEDQFGEFIK